MTTVLNWIWRTILLGTGLLAAQQAQAQSYPSYTPGGAISCTAPCRTQSVNLAASAFVTGPLPYTALPSQSNATLLGNSSGSASTPSALNPLAVANMMSAVMAVDVLTPGNNSLSGLQTIDGISLGVGQFVLAASQTTTSQDGIYVVATGAWTRAVNFPAGFVIAQNCALLIVIKSGVANAGAHVRLDTSGGPITIGTSTQSWAVIPHVLATQTVAGNVTVTDTGLSVAAYDGTLSPVTAVNDCVAFATLNGSIYDIGNSLTATGPCAVTDANGHPVFQGSGTAPAVTGTGCSLVAGSFDNSGAITATGIDTCTLAFGSAFTNTPHCALANQGTTVLATLTSAPTTAHAIFATAAAGTFNYLCL